MSSLSIAVTPSVKLGQSQATLYAFMLDKYNTGQTINLNEVIEQYSSYGNRMVYGGKPRYYRYDWKEHRDILAVLAGEELKTYAVSWFIRNLGVFVAKGVLTALPAMELSQLQIEPDIAPTNKVKEGRKL